MCLNVRLPVPPPSGLPQGKNYSLTLGTHHLISGGGARLLLSVMFFFSEKLAHNFFFSTDLETNIFFVPGKNKTFFL